MEIGGFALPLALLFIGAILIAIITFLSGKKTGSYSMGMEMMEAEKNYTKKLNIEISKNDELQRDINNLKEKNQIYLSFLIKIPDVVKNLNSNLSFDETLSSIIRLTKDILDTGIIELYIFNQETNLIAYCCIWFEKERKGKYRVWCRSFRHCSGKQDNCLAYSLSIFGMYRNR